MLYLAVLWLHIVGGIVALGSNVTYFFVLNCGLRDPARVLFAVSTVRVIDSRLATPAYGVTAVSGLVPVWQGPWSFTTPWVISAIVIFAAVAVIAARVYTPVLKRQLALAEEGNGETDEYQTLHRRGSRAGVQLVVLVLAIVWLMVAKPVLWG